MWRRKADRALDEMISESGLEEEQQPVTSAPADNRTTGRSALEQEARRRDRRSDLTIAALGVTLGLICALFPWYIFFNPDEFGVQAMRFGGGGAGSEPIVLGAQPERIGAPVAVQDIPPMQLDLLATGTAATDDDKAPQGSTVLSNQPFPQPAFAYRVIQIANGRAMLEDDTGLFVVQKGSLLPDSSRVATIEDRDGKSVLVTDTGAVLEAPE